MSVPKSKKPKQKTFVLTESKLNKLIENAKLEMLQQSMILFAAYMMEEPSINCDDDKIIELWKGIERYSNAINDHLIDLENVCNIINEHTQLNIHWGNIRKK